MRRSVQFVTGNEGKYREVLEVVGHELDVGRVVLDLVEIQGTVEEVARDKCARAAAELQRPVLTEDTCLCFDALGGNLPGPYIKWFLEGVGTDGLCKMLDAFPTRSATAVSKIARRWRVKKERRMFPSGIYFAFLRMMSFANCSCSSSCRFALLHIAKDPATSQFCFAEKCEERLPRRLRAKDEALAGIPFFVRKDR